MNCTSCDQIIENRWTYCPSCGSKNKTKLVEGMVLEDIFSNIANDLKEVFLTKQSTKQGKIHITIENINIPQHQKKLNAPNLNEKINHKIPKTIIEPETKIIENRTGIFKIKIALPKITSQKQINLDIFEESFEIRANAKNKMFFKIIKIPANLKLKTKILKSEQLTLTFSL